MDALLLGLGRVAGAGGFLLCITAGALRLAGRHGIAGFEALTLLQAGSAAMTLGCLCFLTILVQRSSVK